jgi:hypothetical protein
VFPVFDDLDWEGYIGKREFCVRRWAAWLEVMVFCEVVLLRVVDGGVSVSESESESESKSSESEVLELESEELEEEEEDEDTARFLVFRFATDFSSGKHSKFPDQNPQNPPKKTHHLVPSSSSHQTLM